MPRLFCCRRWALAPLISSARMKTGNPDIVKAQREATKPPTVHPLVRTHPETGTKAVWFHKGKTETVTGLSPEETQEFLQDLTDRITQPQFCYAHEYKKGDLLIIDAAPHCIKPASITITASIAACIGCLCVATVPSDRRAPRTDANEATLASPSARCALTGAPRLPRRVDRSRAYWASSGCRS